MGMFGGGVLKMLILLIYTNGYYMEVFISWCLRLDDSGIKADVKEIYI